jgi:hypothetical protein
MATAYETQLLNRKFRGNVVIKFAGIYFSINSPDSGLVVLSPFNQAVKSLVIAPTQVDLKRANQTIANYSFKIVDKEGVLTDLTKERANALMGQTVEIWIGRITGSFDFADYFKLPISVIKKISHEENAYHFSSQETTERMNVPVFELSDKLAAGVSSGTTTFVLDTGVADWPTAGTGKVDDEFFSWTGKVVGTKQLTGVVRGEKTTTPVSHNLGATVYRVYDVSDNPINILLKLLISNGGGGAYDVYPDGLGISPTLIDVTAIEAIRDSIFVGETFSYSLYNITNALNFNRLQFAVYRVGTF